MARQQTAAGFKKQIYLRFIHPAGEGLISMLSAVYLFGEKNLIKLKSLASSLKRKFWTQPQKSHPAKSK